MRILIISLILVALLVTLGIFLGPGAVDRIRNQMPKTDGTIVRMAQPERGDLVETINAPGEIEPKSKVDLSARLSARIVKMPFKEGDRVTAGDPDANPPIPPSLLVQLDSTDLAAQLKAAEARRDADAASIEVQRARMEAEKESIEGLRASLRQANLDLQRQSELLASRDIAQSVVDQAQARVDELTASLKAREIGLEADTLNLKVMEHNLVASDAMIEQARDSLTYTTITAPIDGMVTRINAEVGELVMTGTMNNAGTVILQVADLSKMLLVGQVDEASIGGVEVGQKAIIRINAYPGEEFEGVVETIAFTHDLGRDGSKYYKTEILIQTHGKRIYSGLTADVEIETHRHVNVLKVPSQAVLARPVDDLPASIRTDNPNVDMTKTVVTVVYRVIDGKTVVTPVKIGPSDISSTVITSGLNEEDVIVVGPYRELESLRHDMAVRDEVEVEAEKKKLEEESIDADSESTGDADEPPANDDLESDDAQG